jgi:hypothetical protein
MTARLRRLAALAVLPLALLAPTGCEKVRSGVGSSVSPCFRLLPQAHAALGGTGAMVSVVRLRGARVDSFLGAERAVVQEDRRDVCVIAYRGEFDAAGVEPLVGERRTGAYAMVVVGVLSQRVRGVLLSDTLPRPLHHH